MHNINSTIMILIINLIIIIMFNEGLLCCFLMTIDFIIFRCF